MTPRRPPGPHAEPPGAGRGRGGRQALRARRGSLHRRTRGGEGDGRGRRRAHRRLRPAGGRARGRRRRRRPAPTGRRRTRRVRSGDPRQRARGGRVRRARGGGRRAERRPAGGQARAPMAPDARGLLPEQACRRLGGRAGPHRALVYLGPIFYKTNQTDTNALLNSNSFPNMPPSSAHPLGTDITGWDMLGPHHVRRASTR